jgi:glycosyltransferase involved in cell wall biosynthesis
MTSVSVIVPCFNQAIYLDECLQSVINQTYANWECIIVNDGSKDNTEQVVQKWLNLDTRFIYLKKSNGGLASARNAGIEISKGEYILPLDSDDLISPNFVEKAILKISESSEITLVYSSVQKFGIINVLSHVNYDFNKLKFRNQISCTALFRRSDWEKVGGYDENMIGGYEDWEFWINILKRGGKAVLIRDIILYYRIKSSSMYTNLEKQSELVSNLKMYIFKKHFNLYRIDPISLSEIFFFPANYYTLSSLFRLILIKIRRKILTLLRHI